MNWLFAHDHKFFLQKEKVFSKQTFSYESWERYLKHTDTLTVACRLFPLTEEEKRYSLSSGANISFVDIPRPSSVTSFLPYNIALQTMRQAVKSVDAVVARLPSQIGLLAVKAARELGKPYAIEIVGDPKESYKWHGSAKAKLYAPIATRKLKKIAWQARFTLYITENELQKLYPTKGIEISCSNTELPDLTKKTAPKKRNEGNKLIFGMIGSLDSKYKGLDVAIKALSKMKNKLPPFEFRILGSGDTTRWRTIAEENDLVEEIIFDGTRPSHEVFDWLSKIDIYLQPSRTEGQGRSVIEAMYMGCPVITSNVGGMKELTEPEMRFESEDYEQLARLITKLVYDNIFYQKQSERNLIEAKKFTKIVLEKKREYHYKKFKKWIEEQKECTI
ncbi:glycosyltransferase family 4 protein [Listeria booriae]|uniref:Glycosyltransferase n=1 Tax=Listeria booriae TaxID=1552123 RepID=A0A841ZUH3_9LIST|nr:glycosyltransferase [Listeria booriae]MBC1565095.1 glycosyltransferase [Listeria booriae]